MDMTGEYRIPAPREQVWAALNDPEILRQAIPGCDELIKHSDTELEAKVTAKVGPVKAKFGGNVRLENINPPVGYSIVGEGKGGAAGFAKGGADVSLAEDGDGTILTYSAKAEVGGKLAGIGPQLLGQDHGGVALVIAEPRVARGRDLGDKALGTLDAGGIEGGDEALAEEGGKGVSHGRWAEG